MCVPTIGPLTLAVVGRWRERKTLPAPSSFGDTRTSGGCEGGREATTAARIHVTLAHGWLRCSGQDHH